MCSRFRCGGCRCPVRCHTSRRLPRGGGLARGFRRLPVLRRPGRSAVGVNRRAGQRHRQRDARENPTYTHRVTSRRLVATPVPAKLQANMARMNDLARIGPNRYRAGLTLFAERCLMHVFTKRIETWSESVLQLGQGTLYPALYRLERQRLIRSEWKVTENKRRAREPDVLRAHPLGSDAAGQQRGRSGPRDGTGGAGRHPDPRRGRRSHDRPPAGDLRAGWRVRARRPRSGCDWRLRRDGLLGEGANAGNRRPHGARRVGRLDLSHGHRSSVAAGGARHRDGCSPPRGSRLLEPLLFDVQPFDPSTFALTALALLVITAVDAYIPARRGMRMAPIDALRVN